MKIFGHVIDLKAIAGSILSALGLFATVAPTIVPLVHGPAASAIGVAAVVAGQTVTFFSHAPKAV